MRHAKNNITGGTKAIGMYLWPSDSVRRRSTSVSPVVICPFIFQRTCCAAEEDVFHVLCQAAYVYFKHSFHEYQLDLV